MLAMVAFGIAVALLQPKTQAPPDEDGGTIIANGTEPASKEIISVASARSTFPFVQRRVSQYNSDENALGNIELSYYLERSNTTNELVIVGDIRQDTTEMNYVRVSAQAVDVVY